MALALCFLSTAKAQVAAAPPLDAQPFPLEQLKAGQHGTAWTVFQGTQPEAMDVEILGTLHDAIGPGQDMILARLHGTKPEYTGVVAGMSGSPIYIDGKLLGALSYRIGQFSKEPIAGITPIQQMFQVRDLPGTPAPSTPPSAPTVATNGLEMRPIETPLVFNGFSPAALQLTSESFRAMGLDAVAGLGGAADTTPQPEPLIPGSAVSAIFARGDLSIAGTCTVTYVDADRLLACGHPITQFGGISAPMTKAQILATLPSPLNAFKIVNTTETVGAFTQDRASAILGRFHEQARMIPVSVEITPSTSAAGLPRSLHFEVLDNPQLTPQVLLASVFQSLNGTNTSGNEMSFRLTGEIAVAEETPLKLDTLLAPTDNAQAAVLATFYVNGRFMRLYANPLQHPLIKSVTLHADAIPVRKSAQLESARLSKDEANAGDTLTIEATLRPFQGAERIVAIPVRLPSTLQPGPLRILVSDAASLDRLLQPSAAVSAQHPLGLSDTIAQMNREHANDRIYVTLLDHSMQAVLSTAALPSVPPSLANAVQSLRDTREVTLTSESAVEAASVETGTALNGSQILTLVIR
jgi:hypothetical protein